MSRRQVIASTLRALVLGVVGLTACGEEPMVSQLDPASDLASPTGEVIVVTSDSELARQLEGPAMIELTLADGVTVPATTATLVWTTNGQPPTDVVASLAMALGAEGEVRRDAAGAWTVGTSPDSTVGLLAGGYLGDGFTYTSPARWEQMIANPCDSSGVCGGPTGVPDQDVALQVSEQVVASLGVARDRVDLTTEVRDDGMAVTARPLVDGVPMVGQPDLEVLVGSDGSILQAVGRTSVADQTRTIDLVDADTALRRAERAAGIGPFPALPPIAELPATTSLAPSVPAVPGSVSSVRSDVAVVGDPNITADTVTGIGVGHQLAWDVQGRRWIVPTFTLSTADSRLITVFAVRDDQVQIIDAPVGGDAVGDPPGPVEVPMPGAPPPSIAVPAVPVTTAVFVAAPTPPLGAPNTTAVVPCSGTPPSDQPVITVPPALPGPIGGRTREEWGASMVSSISPVVVGLPTSEAAALLEVACWRVRISFPGGTSTTVTPDLPWDRIVLVDDGNGRVAAVVFE